MFAGFISQNPYVLAITPTISGLVDNIWAALLTIIIAEFLRTVYSEQGLQLEKIFEKSLKTINPDVLTHIDTISVRFNANNTLVKAICIVESIQRPKWVRRIEFFKALLRIQGTYGVMQIKSNKPISDIESVDIAIENYFKNTANISNSEDLGKIIENYNPSVAYKDLVERVMYYLNPYSINYPG